jgi:hypothetical protein
MAIELSNDDHDHLTAMIYALLDAAADRQVTRARKREVRGWLKPDTVAAWISRCDGVLCPLCRKKPCVLVEHFGSTL